MIPHEIMDPLMDLVSFVPLSTVVQLLRLNKTWYDWIVCELSTTTKNRITLVWNLRKSGYYHDQWALDKRKIVPKFISIPSNTLFETYITPLLYHATKVSFIEDVYKYVIQIDEFPEIWIPLDTMDRASWVLSILPELSITYLHMENRNTLEPIYIPTCTVTHLSLFTLSDNMPLSTIHHLTLQFWYGTCTENMSYLQHLTINNWEGTTEELDIMILFCHTHTIQYKIVNKILIL
jgi:hypothetical protein